jgi:2Fe-2S ferredoxin
MPSITIVNTGQVLKGSAAKTILQTLQQAGYPIYHKCGGRASCGTCRIKIVKGQEKCSGIKERESIRLKSMNMEHSHRLACQTYYSGDISIDVPKVLKGGG